MRKSRVKAFSRSHVFWCFRAENPSYDQRINALNTNSLEHSIELLWSFGALVRFPSILRRLMFTLFFRALILPWLLLVEDTSHSCFPFCHDVINLLATNALLPLKTFRWNKSHLLPTRQTSKMWYKLKASTPNYIMKCSFFLLCFCRFCCIVLWQFVWWTCSLEYHVDFLWGVKSSKKTTANIRFTPITWPNALWIERKI